MENEIFDSPDGNSSLCGIIFFNLFLNLSINKRRTLLGSLTQYKGTPCKKCKVFPYKKIGFPYLLSTNFPVIIYNSVKFDFLNELNEKVRQ